MKYVEWMTICTLVVGCGSAHDGMIRTPGEKTAIKNHVMAAANPVASVEAIAESAEANAVTADQMSVMLTDTFQIKMEASDLVDLTAAPVQEIFLSSMGTEMKKAGPSVWYKPEPEKQGGTQAVAGQFEIALPVNGPGTLNLYSRRAQSIPSWMQRCEMMVVYHIQCQDSSGAESSSMGYMTYRPDNPDGKVRIKDNSLLVDYICPGFYQAAYNCSEEKLGDSKSFITAVTPENIRDRMTKTPVQSSGDRRSENPYSDINEIQGSSVTQEDSSIQKAFDNAKQYFRAKIAVGQYLEKKTSDEKDGLRKSVEREKEELKQTEKEVMSLSSGSADKFNMDLQKEERDSLLKKLHEKRESLQENIRETSEKIDHQEKLSEVAKKALINAKEYMNKHFGPYNEKEERNTSDVRLPSQWKTLISSDSASR